MADQDTPAPRAELRQLIVEKVHQVDCGCAEAVHTPDARDYYAQVADGVMGLFDIVIYSTDPRIVAYTHAKEAENA